MRYWIVVREGAFFLVNLSVIGVGTWASVAYGYGEGNIAAMIVGPAVAAICTVGAKNKLQFMRQAMADVRQGILGEQIERDQAPNRARLREEFAARLAREAGGDQAAQDPEAGEEIEQDQAHNIARLREEFAPRLAEEAGGDWVLADNLDLEAGIVETGWEEIEQDQAPNIARLREEFAARLARELGSDPLLALDPEAGVDTGQEMGDRNSLDGDIPKGQFDAAAQNLNPQGARRLQQNTVAEHVV